MNRSTILDTFCEAVIATEYGIPLCSSSLYLEGMRFDYIRVGLRANLFPVLLPILFPRWFSKTPVQDSIESSHCDSSPVFVSRSALSSIPP